MCRASAHHDPASLITTRNLTRVNNNDIFNPSLDSHRCNVNKMANLPNGTMGERLKVATRKAKIQDILSLPPKWLSLYSNFITKNQSSVTSIESALRSLTYIIPGRFRDAELASESLHSSIQLLSLYHDTLLLRAISKLPGVPTQQSPHNRYTKFWIQKSKFYRRVAMTLSVVQYTELLWEMMAKRKGEKVRWRIVIVLEIVKAVCRLLLMRITNSRPLVSPPLPEREVIPEEVVEEEEEDDGFRDEGFHEERERPLREKEYKMKRTGLSLPVLPNPSDISSYLLSKVLTADDIKAAPSLLNATRGSAQLAEILHILQPVIYAVAMSRSKDKRNWQPWLLGLSIEYAARQLRKDGLRTTSLEREQWAKRGWAMGWWAMRGAFYENVTKGFLHKTSERLPSLISGVLDDYLYLWDGYYFSTSSN
jgi:peroxin-16